jgi:hypothetical protein
MSAAKPLKGAPATNPEKIINTITISIHAFRQRPPHEPELSPADDGRRNAVKAED